VREAPSPRMTERTWSEAERLAALRGYGVLDTPPEQAFDELVQIAALVCKAPIAVVNLVEDKRQFFKAELGLGVRETPLDVSICAHALLQRDVFVVPDTTKDPRFAGNPLVTGEPHLRFYAGALLETKAGLPIGTICVLDHEPRPDGITPEQAQTLRSLARAVMAHFELRRSSQRIAESERRFRAMADSMPQIVWSTLPDGHHDYYNRRWYEFTGVPEGSTDGEGWNGLFHPDDQERAWAVWRQALATGEPYEIEYRLRQASGGYRWVLGRALPLRDENGAIERWFGTCTDIHDQKCAEAELSRRTAQMETLLATAPVAVWFSDDPAISRVMRNGYAAQLMGVPEGSTATFGDNGAERVPHAAIEFGGRAVPPDRLPLQRAASGEHVREEEYDLVFDDGRPSVTLLSSARPLRDAAGQIAGAIAVSLDITSRKRIEEAKELLAQELSHRIKNIFAVVAGLVAVSARARPEAEDFARGLRDRLHALAVAHEYVRPHSSGSAPATERQTVHGLLALLLEPYLEGGAHRVRISGADAALGPESATALALCLHEQATNAAKYGALSVDGGQVVISCDHTAEDRFRLVWQELGGPPVKGPPERQGFGTTLATRSIRGQLGGTIAYDWRETGLVMTLQVPASSLQR
jgi:PAS domain S-box-containing protein